MNLALSLLSFLSTGPGMLVIGFLAILMILAWEWRASLVGLVLIQLGIAPIAVFRQGVDPQWVTVQTLVIMLCCLMLALSATQIASSPTSRQSGNGPLRLMVIIMLYVSWRLFQFDISIPLIQPQVNVLFTWLFICALLILALSDNPLFTGSALILWFIPMHIVIAVLFPFNSLIVLFGVLELVLALCCSYLILAERLGEEKQTPIATDITFPSATGPRQLVDYAGKERTQLLPNDRTTMDLLAVPMPPETRTGQTQLPKQETTQQETTQQETSRQETSQHAYTPPTKQSLPGVPAQRSSTLPADRAVPLPDADHPRDRTGENPLVSTMAKGKRTQRPNQGSEP